MPPSFRDSVQAIWRAGVEAVLPGRLIRQTLSFEGDPNGAAAVTVQNEKFSLPPSGRVIVVGMGKASCAMAAGTEEVLEPLVKAGRLTGWVNVPADAVIPLNAVHPHAGRPAGLNEPTEEGVAGSLRIEALIKEASADDLILALISGGGSALAPLPVPEITLAEKILVTRLLSGAGANIEELNTVRKQLSRIKGGGLRRLARGKRLAALILSDVLGDPLDVIASGATVPNTTTAADALAVLKQFGLDRHAGLKNVCAALEKRARASSSEPDSETGYENHRNLIIANNRTAVDAAVRKAKQLGFCAFGESAPQSEPDVALVAGSLISEMQQRMKLPRTGPAALISGGEPTVTLAPPAIRGKGGRNTQLVLLALIEALKNPEWFPSRFALLSGGTDGEDGPTDAAGAFFDDTFLARFAQLGAGGLAAAQDAAGRNDSYTFFAENGGLLRSGATGTNVCDLRVLLFSPELEREARSG